jgi:hypothetical protein
MILLVSIIATTLETRRRTIPLNFAEAKSSDNRALEANHRKLAAPESAA